MFSKKTILFCIFATLLAGQTDAKARLHRYGRHHHRLSHSKTLKRDANTETIVQEIPDFNETSLSYQLSENETFASHQLSQNETGFLINITESFQTLDNETGVILCNESIAHITGFELTDVKTASNGDSEVKVEVSIQVDNIINNLEEAVHEAIEKVGQETELFGTNATDENTYHVVSVVTTTNSDGEKQAEIKIEVTYIVAEETASNETATFGNITGNSYNETGSLYGDIDDDYGETDLPIYEFPTRAVEASNEETTAESKSASLGADVSASFVIGGVACLALVLVIVAVAIVANRQHKPSSPQLEECSVLAIEAEEVEADVEAQTSDVKAEINPQVDEAVVTTKESSDEDDVEVIEC